MDDGARGVAYLAMLTLSYWIIGSIVWIRRQRATLRKAPATVLAEDPITGRKLVEIKGSMNLVELAAYAILPPLALGALWFALA